MATISHSKTCQLSEKPLSKAFKTRTVVYCPECSKYAYDEIMCEHEYTPIKFVLNTGTIQVRMYCHKCHGITSKSEPHSKFNMNMLLEKQMDSYREFIDKKYASENKLVKEYTDSLNKLADEFNQKEYYSYLLTDWWKQRRADVLKRDNNTCQICGKEAENVYHLSYVNRGCEYMFELVSLCKKCHEEYHTKQNKPELQST